MEETEAFSITSNKLQQILDNISLETGELTNIYIDDFPGEDISLNNELNDTHISEIRNITVLKTNNDEELTHAKLRNDEKETPLFLKGKSNSPLH